MKSPFGQERTVIERSETAAHLEEDVLQALTEGELDDTQRAAALAHLDGCTRCRQVVALLVGSGGGAPTFIGPSLEAEGEELVGQMLGEYRVLAPLAQGGMGAVYRGVQPVIGKAVALKVLLPSAAADPNLVERLLGEARAVNAARHPNIIDIFSFGTTPGGQRYFVMELLEGESLAQRLQRLGALPLREALVLLEQVLSGLGAAHAAGVLHRDLKPGNLFVSTLADGSLHLKLLDFGLAKQLGARSSTVTSANVLMGTPGYMAPEQIRGAPSTPATDLYAVGVLAWRMLTGSELFTAGSLVEVLSMHVEVVPPRLGTRLREAPARLEGLLQALLEKEPARRPQTAGEVRRELQRMLRQLDDATTQPGRAKVQRRAMSPEVPTRERSREELAAGAQFRGEADLDSQLGEEPALDELSGDSQAVPRVGLSLEAELRDAQLRDGLALLRDVPLRDDSSLQGPNRDLSFRAGLSSDAQLRDAQSRDAQSRDAQSRDAQSRDAQSRDAQSRDAQSRDAQLHDAQLRDAQSRDAQSRDAQSRDAQSRDDQLRDAQLRDAQLRDAQLRDTQLRDAQLRDAQRGDTQFPDDSRPDAQPRGSDAQSRAAALGLLARTEPLRGATARPTLPVTAVDTPAAARIIDPAAESVTVDDLVASRFDLPTERTARRRRWGWLLAAVLAAAAALAAAWLTGAWPFQDGEAPLPRAQPTRP